MPEQAFQILLVEDDQSVRESAATVLREEGYAVTTAVDGQDAVDKLVPGTDLVVADLNMPKMDGLELLRWVTSNRPGTAVILITAYGTIPLAVEATKAGAADFLQKPLDPGALLVQVRKALDNKQLREEPSRLREQSRDGWHYQNIVGHGPRMQHQVFDIIDRVAPVKITVLVVGDTGTGKELVALALHKGSPRSGGPFLALNCGAIPENLIESTLFGHEKGAFTGADAKSRGYFRDANGGTLFLDEIGELPLGLQSKLLRVLEDGTVTPVGTTAPQKVDVRIVAATNRDLEIEAKTGRFRQDLYYRLNVVKIQLPPLRQRPEDLPVLTQFFLDEICRENSVDPRKADPSLLAAFTKYDWPGNVRELKKLLESLVVLSDKQTLTAADLPEKFFLEKPISVPADEAGQPASEAAEELKLLRLSKQTILKALESCHGNRTEAAKQLGISRRTLHRRLNEFGLRE